MASYLRCADLRLAHRCTMHSTLNTRLVSQSNLHAIRSAARNLGRGAAASSSNCSIGSRSFLHRAAWRCEPLALGVRFASSSSPASSPSGATSPPTTGGPTPAGLPFPPRLLVYHAGTWRIVWIATWKIASVVVLFFTAVVIAPALYYAPEIRFPLPWAGSAGPASAPSSGPAATPTGDPSATTSANSVQAAVNTPPGRILLATSIVLGGCLPMYYVLTTTRPFVAFVHVALPLSARRSRPALQAWGAAMPAATRVDITTLRGLGNARQTSTVIAELAEVTRGRRRLQQQERVQRLPSALPSAAPSAPAAVSSAVRAATPSTMPRQRSPGLAQATRSRRGGPGGARTVTRYGDVEIEMTRRRLPGWLPPDASARRWYEGREQRHFLITAGKNGATQGAEVWEAFLERINWKAEEAPGGDGGRAAGGSRER